MGAPGTTEGEWYFEKCGCGHKSCSQYYLGNQGSVGFSLADAQQIAASGALFDALAAFVSDCTNEECERCISARAALAQARGEVSVHTLEGGL